MSLRASSTFCSLAALVAVACADDNALTNPVAPSAIPAVATDRRSTATGHAAPSAAAGTDDQADLALADYAVSVGPVGRPAGTTCRHDAQYDPPGGRDGGVTWIDIRHPKAQLHRSGRGSHVSVRVGKTVWAEWYTSHIRTGTSHPVESCFLGRGHDSRHSSRWQSACAGGTIVEHGVQTPMHLADQRFINNRLKPSGLFRTRYRRRGIAVPVTLTEPGLHIVGWSFYRISNIDGCYPRQRFVYVKG